ncbi:hypothetical protein AVEN_27354-1 [Araneus ventricosus]|uniref:Uncharacterized protein n=1 Tax=Araneus ventricosus TaxID=182803 RepID=A0A4Y2IPY8_ARAVE|nr:hypothetical protein AVEN_27354-1 [Araneus ventricosus]
MLSAYSASVVMQKRRVGLASRKFSYIFRRRFTLFHFGVLRGQNAWITLPIFRQFREVHLYATSRARMVSIRWLGQSFPGSIETKRLSERTNVEVLPIRH